MNIYLIIGIGIVTLLIAYLIGAWWLRQIFRKSYLQLVDPEMTNLVPENTEKLRGVTIKLVDLLLDNMQLMEINITGENSLKTSEDINKEFNLYVNEYYTAYDNFNNKYNLKQPEVTL